MLFISSCKDSIKSINDLDAPTAYYGAVSQDSILFTTKKGHLTIESDHPINDQSQFALFSITKTFTAMAILQLVEAGKVELDDEAND